MKNKIYNLIESKVFIVIVSISMIAFGIYYWSDFSGRIDDLASGIREKIVKSEFSFETNFDFNSLYAKIQSNNLYGFKRDNGIAASYDIDDEKENFKYFYQIEPDSKGLAIVKVRIISGKNCPKELAKKYFDKLMSELGQIED